MSLFLNFRETRSMIGIGNTINFNPDSDVMKNVVICINAARE